MRVLLFSVAGGLFAVDAASVEGVAPAGADTGDDDVPAIDLAALVGSPAEAARSIVMLGEGAARGRLAVDRPRGFADVDAARVAPVPGYLFPRRGRLVRAVFEEDGALCLLLDAGVLIATGRPACT